MAKKKPSVPDGTIALNKKAKHEYFLEESFEAGVVLEGWEVKSLRMKKVQLVDSYVLRIKKLLLHNKQLAKLFANVNQKGHTCVAVKLYWKGHLVKCQIALAKGKQDHDKRATEKDREWAVDKQRIVRHANR